MLDVLSPLGRVGF